MEDPAVVWKFTSFFVKLCTPFLKDTGEFVLPFRSIGVLTGLHAKEKFTLKQFSNVCVQMGVCLIVDVKH